ncbi:terminase small subunit [Paenibacillus shenyangensis]|uniref:terminase small subunit n=1 Tax=Paenibacillus sp. A9 TaxID=1284352 RepID=UPI0003728852|nr:terminase small subunit [Paenibacillus sp. A9]
MGRQRDPKRDEAFDIYRSSDGKTSLVDIANELGVSAGTVRGWKAKDGWDTKLTSDSGEINQTSIDDLYAAAVNIVGQAKKASAKLIQERLGIEPAIAAGLINAMEQNGIVSPQDGDKPRKVDLNAIRSVASSEPKRQTAPKKDTERSKNTERSKKKQNVSERRKPPPEPEAEQELPDIPDESGLTTKQRMFILEYLRDFNATRAAIAAGYSRRSAHVTGWDNLRNPKIKQEIDKVKDDLVDGLGLSVQRIVMEYMKIAFADITDYVAFGRQEVPVMGMFGPVKLNGQVLMEEVNYVEFKESDEIDGTVVSQVKMGKDGASIKLYDKMAALKQLEKYTTFLTDTQKVQLEKARLEVAKLRGEDLTDEDNDDGFMEALGGIAAEVWPDEN